MSRSRSLLLLLSLVATLGCRQGPHLTAQIDLMNAEKRALEDELYAVEFDLEEAQRQLEKLRKENERLRSGSGPRLPRRDSDATKGERPEKGNREGDELAPPMIDEGIMIEPQVEIPDTPPPGGLSTPAAPPKKEPAKKELVPEVPAPAPPSPPAVEKPESPAATLPPPTSPSKPAAKPAAPLPPPAAGGPRSLPAPARPRTSSTFAPKSHSQTQRDATVFTQAPTSGLSPSAPTLETADPRVTHLFLNEHLTGGTDLDRQPGDDGIVVVLEPRNAAGAFVPLAGPLSILVLDPTKQPNEGRVLARWEVNANDAQRALENTSAIRGIHLRLPWPSGTPKANHLRLYVRYITVDNRELRADREIFLTLPGQFSQTWTPRATTRGGTTAVLAQPQTVPAEPPSDDLAEPVPMETDPSAETPQVASPEWRPYR